MKKYILLAFVALMTACASSPQLPVSVQDNFWQANTEKKKIGIIMSKSKEKSSSCGVFSF